MQLPQYVVIVDTPDGPVEHTVAIRNVDRLLCEKEGPRYGIRVVDEDRNPVVLPQHMSTFWCWAALKREGLYDGTYSRFETKDCINIDGDVPDLELSPTPPPTHGGSHSSSPSTSEIPATGSESPEPQTATS